ncbi:MAG: hypothetical protein IH997_14390 [Proteobacteria bacterium]|nr:hypothetical protein [Pseudomonadota bacterium]
MTVQCPVEDRLAIQDVLVAYVIGMGVGKDGRGVTVNGRYYFDVRRTDAGWKATRYTMDFLLPLSGTLDNAK